MVKGIYSGRHDRIVGIMDAAQQLGRWQTEMLFGRSAFCDLFNRYPFSENALYVMEATKVGTARGKHFRENNPESIEAFENLERLRGNLIPRLISTFRIVRDSEHERRVALCNYWGQTSGAFDEEYFDVRTKVGLRSRSLRQGEYHWIGPSALVRPFIDYCLKSGDALMMSSSEARLGF